MRKLRILWQVAVMLCVITCTMATAAWADSVEPKEITTQAELAAIVDDLDGNYILMNDIELSGEWKPIGGSSSSAFMGTFDGNGYEVSGLSINIENTGNYTYYEGLFGYASSDSIVKNVTVSGSITMTSEAPTLYAGGVVGYLFQGTVDNCKSDVTLNLSTVTSTPFICAGGVVGQNDGTVKNCQSSGDITAYANNTGTNVAGARAGGLVGWNTAYLMNSYAIGDISATAEGNSPNARAGGVAGSNSGTMKNCYATGATTVSAKYAYEGGIVGDTYGDGVVENCYWLSTATEDGFGYGVGTDCEGFTDFGEAMALLDKLNTCASDNGYNSWIQEDGTYPTFAMAADVDGTEYFTIEQAVYAANKTTDAKITLLKNVETTDTLEIKADMTLDLAGLDIHANVDSVNFSVITIAESIEFTLTDSGSTGTRYIEGVGKGATITETKTDDSIAVTGGVIYGGTGNSNADNILNRYDGGGVYVYGGGAIFNMQGGTIAGNTANYGGGLYANDGTSINMEGGAIAGNTATNESGGVCIYSKNTDSTFAMSGNAKITNNSSPQYGGVYLYFSSLTMSNNAEISGNTSTKFDCGGVNGYKSPLTMNGNAKISGNVGSSSGGVYICQSSLTMNDNAEISGNTSTKYDGGGVKLYESSLTMNGNSKISGNTAKRNGGGVYTMNTCTVTFSGSPAIKDNTSDNLYLCNGAKVSVGADGLTADASIAVTTKTEPADNAPVVFADNGKDYIANFISNSKLYKVVENEEGLALAVDEDIVASKVYCHVCDEDQNAINDATATIMYGKKIIDSAQRNINSYYTYPFGNVPAGTYNLVVTSGDTTVTTLLEVGEETVYQAVTLTDYSSTLEIKGEATPNIVVGNLDQAAIDNSKDVVLTLESKAEADLDSAKVDAISEVSSDKIWEYLDTSLDSDNTVIELIVPYDFTDKDNVEVYLIEGDDNGYSAKALGSDTTADYYLELDEEGGFIHIYSKYLATFAIGYDDPSSTSSSSSPIIIKNKSTLADTENGKAELSGTNNKLGAIVTVTATPDEGYEVGTVTVAYDTGREVSVKDNGDGTYTYSQPGADVIVTVTFTAIGETENDNEFIDVSENDWFCENVETVVDAGLMDGISDTKFDPYGSATRAMIVTMLWRLEGEPVVNYLMTFEDVDPEQWYGEAIRWASSEQIVKGYSDSEFAPNKNISREQVAAILHRYSVAKGDDVSVGENTNILSYMDAFDISDYAFSAMQWVCGADLMDGYEDGTLAPTKEMIRAEIAAIFARYIAE